MELKTTVKDAYAKLLSSFKIQGMKSSDFCLTWDNLVIPGDIIVNSDKKRKEEFLLPAFCKDKPFGLDEVMVLWDFKSDDDAKKEQRKKAKAERAGEKEDVRKDKGDAVAK